LTFQEWHYKDWNYIKTDTTRNSKLRRPDWLIDWSTSNFTMSGLLRYQVFLGYAFLFLAIWYAGLSSQNDLESPNPLIVYAPVGAIILLAIYGIGSIAYGVAVFEDMPEAAAEIDKQVIEARQEMRKRGVIKDWRV
jgi:hypothetical protein